VPNHWTYRAFHPGDDLAQGDIIARTEPVLGILKDIHAYFCNPKYLCFIILTQSCDLVMRGGTCKAKQISLGVVRSLDDILSDNLAELCGTGFPGIYRQDARLAAQQFLERVLNQNEQAHGLFYLHPDADVGIAVPAVAMLRVSISLRSREHYKTLRGARRGCLKTEYRNKLGWLTGNLYSRVDTTDWADQEGGEVAADQLIRELLDGVGTVEQNVWVPDLWLEAAKAKRVNLQTIPRNRVYATLKPLAPPPPLSTAIERVKFNAMKLLSELNDAQFQQLIDLAKADVVCPLLGAQAAFCVARTVMGPTGEQLLALLDRMPSDARLNASMAAQVGRAVTRFKVRRGPREIGSLLDLLRDTPLFDAPAVACACEIADQVLGASFTSLRDAFTKGLQAERMGEPVIAQLHGLIRQVVDEALVERLLGRLENDGQFKGALKRA
jgi:hypothetical protein